MSNSHGSTSGHFAHPTPSDSGGSFQSHQRQTSDDGLPRRPSAGTSPRTEVLCQGGHTSSSPIPPPLSPSPSPPPPLTSPSFTESQQCAQQPKDKSAEAMGKDNQAAMVDISSGVSKTATSVSHSEGKAGAVSSATPPTEKPYLSGEEMAGAKPKKFRSSSHTMDVQTEHRTQSLPPAEDTHSADIMRTVTFPQPCVTEGGGSSKGKTVAEIHAHEDTAPQRSQSGVHHSQKRPTGSYRQSPLHLHHDRGDSQTLASSESRSSDSQQVASKRSKTTADTTPMDHTTISGSTAKGSNQSKGGKTGATTKTPASPSAANKDLSRSDGQGEIMGVSKRIQSVLPSGDMWDSSLEPDQLLEERLSATVIRRHVKVRSSTTAAAKKQQEPIPQTATPTNLQKDVADSVTPQENKTTKEDSHETPQVKKESVRLKSENPPDCPADVIQSTTQTPPSSTQGSEGKPKSAQRTVVSTPEKVATVSTSSSKVSDQRVSKPEKSSPLRSVETKQVLDDNPPPLRKKVILQKTRSAEQESLLPPKKESSLLKDRSPSVKSHGQGTKHVSIREPPEMVVMVKDSDPSTQTTALSLLATKDGESPGTSFQRTSGDSASCSGTWVEEKRESVCSPEAKSLPNPRHSKSCCFCWCCCCSCSCLSSTNTNNNKPGHKPPNDATGNFDQYFNGEAEPQPTLEEIRSWGESFDKLMKCGAGRKVFREFLQCEYSEENILFWLACEDLKKETNPEIIEEKARQIYESFISILSPREVSLDSRVRDIVNKNMVRPTTNTFDEAQLQIYTLMHRDSYPRFVNSAIYRKLAQLPAPSRKGSMA